MEEFPQPGHVNGTHAQQPRTKEEQDNDALFWVEHYRRLCQADAKETPDTQYLLRPSALKVFHEMWRDSWHIYQGELAPLVRELGGRDMWHDLDKAVQNFVDPETIPVTLPHVSDQLMPPLPARIQYDPALAHGAGEWLDGYCAFSQQASPRGAARFHAGVGLWILSTIVARRICVEAGRRHYPILFFALVARSTLYAKTTTAELGVNVIEDALSCPYLLAPDSSTPQALIRDMSGRAPQDYAVQTPDEQELTRKRLAFAAQKGWLYDEWGGLLKQMTRRDSTMSGFHELLRQLDDGRQRFTSNTISRGMESVNAPYLALLANATPHDLQRFMEPGSPFWHDGFWPRFAFLFPSLDELPNLQTTMWQLARLPGPLVYQLHQWHNWLGVPEVDVLPVVDTKGQPTGAWRVDPRVALPCHVLPVDPAVRDAYQSYNTALLEMVIRGEVQSDLESWYGRLHAKCLRVAMLLCSLKETTATCTTPTLTMPYWVYAQQITESWRASLHEGLQIIGMSQPLSREEQLEQKIETLLRKDGPRTARECQQYLNNRYSSAELKKALTAMAAIGRLVEYPTRQTVRYGLPVPADDLPAGTDSLVEEEASDVPF